ncbi:RadC-like JAB domain-containing protein [Pseudomonas sp. NFR09]|nr:RadC-like JAB domain-containing protein [Pseudomonas sp. NFR09]
MSSPLTLIETSDFEADRIVQENQLIDEALHILDRRLFSRGPKPTSPDTVTSYLKLQLTQQEHEVFGVIFFDAQHRVLAFEILFHGSIDGASVTRANQLLSRCEAMQQCGSDCSQAAKVYR